MITVGAAGAIAAQAANGRIAGGRVAAATTVGLTDTGCECEEGTGSCPTPPPGPVPSATSVPSLPPSYPATSASPALRLASANRIAAPTLVLTVDIDMSNFVNGQEVFSTDKDGKPAAEVKSQCPKNARVSALYTNNPFQGHLLSISFIHPRIDMENCEVTIKVLDPRTGRVLETYESPSDLIVIVRASVGFLHMPARIKVEVTCDR